MRSTQVTSAIALAAFLPVLVLVPSCGIGSSSGQALAPGATMDWATSVLGAAPTSFHALHLRVQPNLQGWSTTRGIVDSVKAAMEGCGQIDVYDDEALIVLHDVPLGLDPARPLRSSYPDFTFLSQAPSGLRLYARARTNDDTAAVPVLVVQPPATWFLGDRLVLTRLTLSLSSSSRVPYLAARPGSIADTFIGGASPPYWVPFADQAVGGGVVMYPFPGAAPAPVAVKVVYKSSSGASAAAADLRRLWQAGMLRSANQPARDRTMDDFLAHVSGIQDEGSTLLVQSNVGPDTAADFASRL